MDIVFPTAISLVRYCTQREIGGLHQETRHENKVQTYHLLAPSYWPIIASVGLFALAGGFTMFLNHIGLDPYVMSAGAMILVYMLFGWFGEIIRESQSGRFKTGIYGATFYILTGFHGAHVTLGAIMLTVILFRVLAGHFTPDHHFAFEAVSWYWHFVDVIWLLLFVFVYWL